jgi:hypothetical protein
MISYGNKVKAHPKRAGHTRYTSGANGGRSMSTFLLGLTLTVLCLGPSQSATAQIGTAEAPLTNAGIVKLVQADFKEKTIIAIIGSRPSRFDLSTERLIELKRNGVSEKIILAMLARQQGVDFDGNWKNSAEAGTATDIFGSSGGVRGNTQSRGGNSSGAADSVSTGSATVRILRPPSEADAPIKLERVATLTNDSIVELIDAGFSEGTIIRRIERSPVEFDLSPAKLTDLRKHRVTDKILSAMKAASGDTGDAKTATGSNGNTDQ